MYEEWGGSRRKSLVGSDWFGSRSAWWNQSLINSIPSSSIDKLINQIVLYLNGDCTGKHWLQNWIRSSQNHRFTFQQDNAKTHSQDGAPIQNILVPGYCLYIVEVWVLWILCGSENVPAALWTVLMHRDWQQSVAPESSGHICSVHFFCRKCKRHGSDSEKPPRAPACDIWMGEFEWWIVSPPGDCKEKPLHVIRARLHNLLLFALLPLMQMQMHEDLKMTHKRLLGRCELETGLVAPTEYWHVSPWIW